MRAKRANGNSTAPATSIVPHRYATGGRSALETDSLSQTVYAAIVQPQASAAPSPAGRAARAGAGEQLGGREGQQQRCAQEERGAGEPGAAAGALGQEVPERVQSRRGEDQRECGAAHPALSPSSAERSQPARTPIAS